MSTLLLNANGVTNNFIGEIICRQFLRMWNGQSTGRPSKRFWLADCVTTYTIYLSLFTQTADPNHFRGTNCTKSFHLVLNSQFTFFFQQPTFLTNTLQLHCTKYFNLPVCNCNFHLIWSILSILLKCQSSDSRQM